MDLPKYTERFITTAKVLVPKNEDKYLALASLQPLQEIFKDVNPEDSIDLLFLAGNLMVGNIVNRNGVCISNADTIRCFQMFARKFIDLEHDRKRIHGFIDRVSLSKFGDNALITVEEAAALGSEPFNVTIGGVLWKVLNKNLSDYLIRSADENAEEYGSVSLSFEVGYDEFAVAVGPTRNLTDARILTDEKEIAKYSRMLIANKGKGTDGEGNYVFKVLTKGILPLGAGLVTKPAAFVEGITTITAPKPEQPDVSAVQIISQTEKPSVNNNIITMPKLESLKDIESNWGEIRLLEDSASLAKFISDELTKESEKFAKQLADKEAAVKSAEESAAASAKKLEEATLALSAATEKLNAINAAAEAKASEELFSSRMASFDEKFVLTDEDRQILAGDIKGLTEEQFATYSSKFEVLAKEKCKAFRKAKAEAVVKGLKEKGVKASVDETTLEFTEVFAAAQEQPAEVSTGSQPTKSLKDQMDKAFEGKVKINGKTIDTTK